MDFVDHAREAYDLIRFLGNRFDLSSPNPTLGSRRPSRIQRMGRLLEHRLDGLGEVAAYGNDGQGRLSLVLGLSASEERVVALDQIEPWHLPLVGFFPSPVSGRDR